MSAHHGNDRSVIDAHSLLATLPLAAAVLDETQALVACNARFRELTGLDETDAVGASFPAAIPAAVTSLVAAAAGATKGRVEIVRAARFDHVEGERRADVTFAPFMSGERGLVVVTAVDVSEIIASQDRRAHERRLATVGQVAAGVVHDVNNALNSILAAAFLLEANADDPAAVRDYASRIAKAAETGAAAASRMGRFIRQEPRQDSHGTTEDLSDLAAEVVAMTRPCEDPDTNRARQPASGVARRRILVVEDHADGREFMRTVLQLEGHSVDAVDSIAAAAALLVLESDVMPDAPYDVVVTDVGLPDGSGRDLIARVRARWPAIRLGIVAGWEPEMAADAACDFALRKPVRPVELLTQVAAT